MELIIWLCAVELLLIISGAILIIFDEAAIFMLVLIVAIIYIVTMHMRKYGMYKCKNCGYESFKYNVYAIGNYMKCDKCGKCNWHMKWF